MTDPDPKVALYVDGDRAAVVGPDDAVDALLRKLRPVPAERPADLAQRLVDLVASTTGLAVLAAEHSGRWVQLTPESVEWLQQFQPVTGAHGALLGVVRGSQGQFAHTLSFTASHADPTLLADLHTFGATLAVRLAIARVERAVERIDAKVELLLADTRAALTGEVRGATQTLDRVHEIYEQTGRVTDVHWAQVQHLAAELARLNATLVEQLTERAHNMREAPLKERASQASQLAHGDLLRRLALLAVVQRDQLRWHELELARLAQTDGNHLAEHERAVARATERTRLAISKALDEMHDALRHGAHFTDLDHASHPHKIPALIADCTTAHQLLSAFATACELPVAEWSDADVPEWSTSVKAVARSTGETAVKVGRSVGPVVAPASFYLARGTGRLYRRLTASAKPLEKPAELDGPGLRNRDEPDLKADQP